MKKTSMQTCAQTKNEYKRVEICKKLVDGTSILK